jgi:membrane-associated protein
MPHGRFTAWNAISAVLWAGVLGIAGALLGTIPWVAANIDWIMVAIVVVTVLPVGLTALKRRRELQKEGR